MLHLKIGDLARRTQCPAQTIRYYERAGLLPRTTHTAGNYRVYEPAHIERLFFIRNCRFLDMTLDEIRQLLRARDVPHENCEEAHRLLDEHIAHVGTRVPAFAGSRKAIESFAPEVQRCEKAKGMRNS